MLVSMLVTLVIVMVLVGGIPTLGEFLVILAFAVPLYMLVTFLRNRLADSLVSGFLGGGAPPTSQAEMQLDVADGYAQQQEYDAALYAYEQALNRATKAQRGTVMLRLAETATLAGRAEEALRWWGEALKQKKGLSPDQRAGALFRMAEVVNSTSKDVRTTVQLLKRVLDEYPGTKYASYATDRLRVLVAQPPP